MRFCFLLGLAIANPVFHRVNDFDLAGKKCPLQDNRKALCPAVCVKSRSLCPENLKKECDAGESLCDDGTCQKSCRYVHNVCACGGNSDFVPCRADYTVYVKNFNPQLKVEQVTGVCIDELSLNGNLTSWATRDQSDMYWGLCPERPDQAYKYSEPMWISVFSILGIEACLFAVWFLYKSMAERGVSRLMASESA
ncbi:hypothetical protein DSO57_1039274, partial [Entomophthora muscae]